MKILKLLMLIAIALVLSYCGSNQYIPTHQHVMRAEQNWNGVDSVYLFKGYGLYREKCGGCHYLYKPGSYSAKEWERVLPVMKDKAKLSNEEYGPLEKYVLTLCPES